MTQHEYTEFCELTQLVPCTQQYELWLPICLSMLL